MRATAGADEHPILLIAGPIGAGKTTVAKRLAATWGRAVAHIEGDTFWKFFVAQPPAASATDARKRDSRIVVQCMIASAARFSRGGYDAVCDFTVGPWALPAIREGLGAIPLDFVVICPSADVCANRAAGRETWPFPAYEPLLDLHRAYRDLGALEPHAIRDDDAEPDELAARIHTGLAAGAYRVRAS